MFKAISSALESTHSLNFTKRMQGTLPAGFPPGTVTMGKPISREMPDGHYVVEYPMTYTPMPAAAESRERLQERCRRFEADMTKLFCERYLQHHAKLPGSERTARLRKKRRDIVWRWHGAVIEELYKRKD